MFKKIIGAAAFSPQTYFIIAVLFTAYTAVIGGFAYHRGALSNAKEIGRLEIEVATEKDKNTTCINLGKEQNLKIEQMRQEAERRSKEAQEAFKVAKELADTYKKRSILLAQRTPSRTCGEAANKLREQLRIERNQK